jgi:hypothetical protein
MTGLWEPVGAGPQVELGVLVVVEQKTGVSSSRFELPSRAALKRNESRGERRRARRDMLRGRVPSDHLERTRQRAVDPGHFSACASLLAGCYRTGSEACRGVHWSQGRNRAVWARGHVAALAVEVARFRPRERLPYQRDLRDSWRTYPVCIAGKRAARPADCGEPSPDRRKPRGPRI